MNAARDYEMPPQMGPDEVRNALFAADLSQRGAAKLLEIDERTMRYYCAGKRPVPRAVQFALYYLVLHILNPTLPSAGRYLKRTR